MIEFTFKDALDILSVALILYYINRLMRESNSANIFSGIIIFLIVWMIVYQVYDMRLLGTILDKLVDVGALALIILFQEEIRRFFSSIGTHRQANVLLRWITGNKKKESSRKEITAIVLSCMSMSKQRVGALIVIERNIGLSDIVRSGELIDATISQRLIENIFFKNSPLHDGALIISHKRIKAAGCILPISHNPDIPKSLGLRHRAALGITQKSDALAIIVSEETGSISIAMNGQFQLRLTPESLERILTVEMI